MSFKVVRNAQGQVIAYGPNDDNYEPGQPYSIEENQPTIEQTPKEKLAALEATYSLTQRNLRELIMLTAEALKSGTPIDVTGLPVVKAVYTVEEKAKAIRVKQ
tara:strand:+ start:4955 stop:5263 length:309 start_codon:yes stop_codon:yes gene_type:complete